MESERREWTFREREGESGGCAKNEMDFTLLFSFPLVVLHFPVRGDSERRREKEKEENIVEEWKGRERQRIQVL